MTAAFDGVIGHGQIARFLVDEASTPANSYLFIGAAGVGKATMARAFAELLVCPTVGSHDEPCRSCRRVRSGSHPDVIPVEPQGRLSIGVEDARAMVLQASMTPVESARKVFVVEEAGSMTESAANSLLKTLEEPSPTTVFILIAESDDDLPSTVASRCRTIHFGRVDDDALRQGLVDRGVDATTASDVAQIAGGRPGLALALTRSDDVISFREAWLTVPNRVTNRPGDSFVLAEEMLGVCSGMLDDPVVDDDTKAAKERAARAAKRAEQSLLVTGLEILASWYADAAAIQYGAPIRNRGVPLVDLTAVSPRGAVARAGLVLDAASDLQSNLRPQLLLANLFTSLADDV